MKIWRAQEMNKSYEPKPIYTDWEDGPHRLAETHHCMIQGEHAHRADDAEIFIRPDDGETKEVPAQVKREEEPADPILAFLRKMVQAYNRGVREAKAKTGKKNGDGQTF